MSQSLDGLLRSYSGATCPQFAVLQAADEAKPMWAQEQARHQKLFDELPAMLGVKPDIDAMWAVSDPLVTDRAHGLPFPSNLVSAYLVRAGSGSTTPR